MIETEKKQHDDASSEEELSTGLDENVGAELVEDATAMQLIDVLLKTPQKLTSQIVEGRSGSSITILLKVAAVCTLIYGLIVGSFSGNIQWIAAPAKILSGSALSALLCFPSLYIFACLSGASIKPSQAFAMICSGMALTTILLLGFAPVAFIFTFSIESIFFMGTIHLLVWGVSMYFGLSYIYKTISGISNKDNNLIKMWGLILIVTMLQMSTTLRPIIGESGHIFSAEKRSFVEHWIDNSSSNKKSY